jgi:hypothetical protein
LHRINIGRDQVQDIDEARPNLVGRAKVVDSNGIKKQLHVKLVVLLALLIKPQ